MVYVRLRMFDTAKVLFTVLDAVEDEDEFKHDAIKVAQDVIE